jgi:hypothetical protein
MVCQIDSSNKELFEGIHMTDIETHKEKYVDKIMATVNNSLKINDCSSLFYFNFTVVTFLLFIFVRHFY